MSLLRRPRGRRTVTYGAGAAIFPCVIYAPRSKHVTRAAFVLIATVAASVLIFPVPAFAQQTFAYAGYASDTTNVYGIDGYIRQSGTVALTNPQHHALWVNLCRSNCGRWVQIGEYQGYLPNSSSPTVTHVYIENNWDNCYYNQSDMGLPIEPNDPYYINYTGVSALSGCGGTQYQFAFRRHSFTSTPIGYGWLSSTSGVPYSKDELYGDPALPPLNVDWVGTNDSHIAVAGNGLHVQNSAGGTWNLWTSSSVSGTYAVNDDPPQLGELQIWWAFKATP